MARSGPLVLLLLGALCGCTTLAGVPHSHHHAAAGHKEREADGAFSPRDRDHDHDHAAGVGDAFDHEAILGSSKEAEEFDSLPPAEAKRKLRLLLLKMDRDNDMKISRRELEQWILRSFRSLAEEESAERMTDADANGDGFVTWKEYRDEEFDIDDDEDEEEQLAQDPDRADELAMLQEDKMLFAAADRNGDGRLSTTEFLSFTHPEEDPAMHDTVLAQVLKMKDTDEDGLVDFQEFIGDRGRNQSKEWVAGEKDRFDSELDKDGDGKLDKVEILMWMVPSNEDMARDEASHLFAGADDDVDGELSFDEVVDHHDLFVGSEATDYGEMLTDLRDEL